jgi:hypothetical protein
VGSTELLLDDSIRFARKCPSATLEVWHDMPHIIPAFSFLPEAQEALERMVRFIDKVMRPKQRNQSASLPSGSLPIIVASKVQGQGEAAFELLCCTDEQAHRPGADAIKETGSTFVLRQ